MRDPSGPFSWTIITAPHLVDRTRAANYHTGPRGASKGDSLASQGTDVSLRALRTMIRNGCSSSRSAICHAAFARRPKGDAALFHHFPVEKAQAKGRCDDGSKDSPNLVHRTKPATTIAQCPCSNEHGEERPADSLTRLTKAVQAGPTIQHRTGR